MLEIKDYIVFGIGAVLLGIWLVLFFTGLKYASLFDALTEKEFPLKEIYFVGYAALELVHYSYKSKAAQGAERAVRRKIRGVLSACHTRAGDHHVPDAGDSRLCALRRGG